PARSAVCDRLPWRCCDTLLWRVCATLLWRVCDTTRRGGDLGVGVAELAEDLAVVLAREWAGTLDRAGCRRQVDRHPDLGGMPELGVVDDRNHVVGDELSVRRAVGAERVLHRLDGF